MAETSTPTPTPVTALEDDITTAAIARRRMPLAVAALLGIVGAALVWIGTAGLTKHSAYLRLVLVLAGLVGLYIAIDRLARRLIRPDFDTGFWLSAAWVAIVVLGAILADVLPLAEARDTKKTFSEPIAGRPDLFSKHPLGTDKFGLDLLGGVFYGARLSLEISVGAALIGLVVGGLIGVCAGYFRGALDGVIGTFTDALLAFPPLILLIALMVAVKPSVPNLMIALAVLGIPTYIRLARASTLTIAQREFVMAARAMGATKRRIILRELVPNVALPLVSYAFLIIAVLIVAEGSLSFLSLSIPRPEPTWGNMIQAGSADLRKIPHLVFVPATVMFLTVLALNRLGDFARKKWDNRETRM